MSVTNKKPSKSHVYEETRLAGGYGPRAAKQSEEMQLRRMVMACLLWEDLAYTKGKALADEIKTLCHKIPTHVLADISIEAREQQKLRHVPLLLCRELARHRGDKAGLAPALARVIRRPDEMCEFLALYWKDNVNAKGEKSKTLSSQVKKGLRQAFLKFDEYQFAKYDKDGKEIKLRDVMFLVHPRTKDTINPASSVAVNGVHKEKYTRGMVLRHPNSLCTKLTNKTLATPDTWEAGLSAAKSPEEKRAVWERLLLEKKLPAFAFLKNLRNMKAVNVNQQIVAEGLLNLKPDMLLPLDFLKAATHAPEWTRELDSAMLKCAGTFPKLKGRTIFVVDVSGSMNSKLSAQSEFTRLSAAAAMTVLASEMCEYVDIYATAGNDGTRTHRTQWVAPVRGFALSNSILEKAQQLGGGGIFTRQCLEYIANEFSAKAQPDRIIVFSDSQDCDLDRSKKPAPFGKYNYIVDVSAHQHGINYEGVWTREISGWSSSFLTYIAACEAETGN